MNSVQKNCDREVQILLSVVIPTLNSTDTVQFTLSSIFSNKFPLEDFEVIVVDNGSLDNTVNVVRRFPVKLYFSTKKGMCPTLNVGIRKAKGDIVCITAADCTVADDWLKRIEEFFDQHPDVHGVGGPVFSPLTGYQNEIQKATAELWVEDQRFSMKVIDPKYLEMYGGGLLGGANCAYRRKTLIAHRCFEESIAWGDVDFCWRLIKKGKRLVFDPKIKVVHLGFPSTLQGILKQQFKWGKGHTEAWKKHRSFSIVDDAKNEFWSFRQLAEAFLLLLQPSCHSKTKGLVRFCHYTSFYLGRIYGRR